MSQSSEAISTDAIAEREARQQKRARHSPWVVASRIVSRYRARFVPWIFALIILVPGAMMLVTGRDLGSKESSQFDVIGLSAMATMIGRTGTLAILLLGFLAIFAWFASDRRGQKGRGQKGREQRGALRRQGAGRSAHRIDRDSTRSPSEVALAIDASVIADQAPADAAAVTDKPTLEIRRAEDGEAKGTKEAAVRRRMLATSHAARIQGRADTSRRRRRAQDRGRVGARALSKRLPVTWLLLAALLFHVTNAILPQLTGLADRLQPSAFYFAVVVLALYASRRMPRRKVLDAIQWSIALYLIAGIALAIINPAAAVTSAGLEQRLGFVSSRFWGVGSNPNSVAPLAILQLILQLRQHWRPSPFWLLANFVAAVAAIVVIIWAQSQTAWAAAALILPWVFIRSRLDRRVDLTTIQAHHAVIGLIGVLIAVGFLGAELISRNTVGAMSDALPGAAFWKGDALTTATRVGDQFMTGRGIIWSLALDVWRDHPWFGFGSTAWDYDFRQAYGLPLATSAHNQWMQALSMAGLVGAVPMVIYFLLLAWFSWRASGPSRGLSLAVFALLVTRMVTEVPLESRILLSSDVVQHLALLFVLFSYALAAEQRSVGGSVGQVRRSRSSGAGQLA